jgi:hypothetical protein
MKRKTGTKSAAASTAAVLSAGVFLAHGSVAAADQQVKGASPSAQAGTSAASANRIFIKWAYKDAGAVSTAGMLDGRPVFRNAKGEFFQMDASTGDLKFLSAESLGYIKLEQGASGRKSADAKAFIKFDGIKGEQKVKLLGVDGKGNAVQQNARGESFYLDANGDIKIVGPLDIVGPSDMRRQ